MDIKAAISSFFRMANDNPGIVFLLVVGTIAVVFVAVILGDSLMRRRRRHRHRSHARH